jgi:hypothetical protein
MAYSATIEDWDPPFEASPFPSPVPQEIITALITGRQTAMARM